MIKMKKYVSFQDCSRIHIRMPYDYVNRRCETSSHISKRVHSDDLYRVFNVNDRFVLRSRSHQGSDRQINVSCIVAGCYPQDTPVRVVETTMVILQFYSDSDGIVPSARQDHKTSYIEDITKLLQIKIKFKSFVAKHPNIKLPTGVLLCGPPGVGKRGL